jgi:hypothetical protein
MQADRLLEKTCTHGASPTRSDSRGLPGFDARRATPPLLGRFRDGPTNAERALGTLVAHNPRNQLSFHCALLDPRTTSTGSFQ